MDGSPLSADQVILNANIITIDPKRPEAEALAILHGRFIAVGNDPINPSGFDPRRLRGWMPRLQMAPRPTCAAPTQFR